MEGFQDMLALGLEAFSSSKTRWGSLRTHSPPGQFGAATAAFAAEGSVVLVGSAEAMLLPAETSSAAIVPASRNFPVRLARVVKMHSDVVLQVGGQA
ncbi:hypothetical protein BMH32_08335 [Leucobacter sp. OLJS4]|nr:hypothetical protein BMH25_10495 [Leucobacter sp. OLCALW19]PII87512.1 hypothetical protein BMH26_10315 [Leucobacter sp. OLTLW20]PII94430.1 hypothetical protein BMH27_00085 [Leucobacter sp. OLAS13]PIJ00770.1 hypothetical protein BMH29_01430 [Leucobacter sp. OLDS2]PIJ00829.1 hypothetical protein BMH28_08760 [Leucobacter sp. OLCS4]PIJ03404.1 hypothetical protein BMH31_08010 [Leucobacter sp. OLIS6]PIJ10743.1 hypothetical protein BMH32_08335 [Leucobacter sp. OLJS4]PIJ53517.1 hypothetical prote